MPKNFVWYPCYQNMLDKVYVRRKYLFQGLVMFTLNIFKTNFLLKENGRYSLTPYLKLTVVGMAQSASGTLSPTSGSQKCRIFLRSHSVSLL